MPIPEVDRGKTDARNLLYVVVAKNEEKQLYQLGTKTGKLKQYYTRNEFDVCKQKFLSIEEVPNEEKSLREIVSQVSLTGGQGYKRCTCKGTCETKKCKCRFSKVLCNSKCHGSNPCRNKD